MSAQHELRWCPACQALSERVAGWGYCNNERRSSMGLVSCGAVTLGLPNTPRFHVAEAAYRLGGLQAAAEAYHNWRPPIFGAST